VLDAELVELVQTPNELVAGRHREREVVETGRHR
jgi:hypothetical protein